MERQGQDGPEIDPLCRPEPTGEASDPQPRTIAGKAAKRSLGWFRRSAMTVTQLLERRREYQPPGPLCRACRHLGGPTTIPDRRGQKRVRRRCPVHPLGFTDSDWPACCDFAPREAPDAF